MLRGDRHGGWGEELQPNCLLRSFPSFLGTAALGRSAEERAGEPGPSAPAAYSSAP